MIRLRELTVSRGGRVLLSEAEANISPGERVALFNRAGYLEIAINSHSVPGGKGGADSLLGLSHGTPVRVEFEG